MRSFGLASAVGIAAVLASGTAMAGKDLGERLIRAGLAVPEIQYLKNDPGRATRYRAAFAQAKASRAGAFAGTWIEPSRWRHGERLRCERRPAP